MSTELKYVNGLNISQARKVVTYVFGDFFIKGEPNDSEKRFDFYLKDKITHAGEVVLLKDATDLEYFNKYWNDDPENPKFKLIVLSSSL